MPHNWCSLLRRFAGSVEIWWSIVPTSLSILWPLINVWPIVPYTLSSTSSPPLYNKGEGCWEWQAIKLWDQGSNTFRLTRDYSRAFLCVFYSWQQKTEVTNFLESQSLPPDSLEKLLGHWIPGIVLKDLVWVVTQSPCGRSTSFMPSRGPQ